MRALRLFLAFLAAFLPLLGLAQPAGITKSQADGLYLSPKSGAFGSRTWSYAGGISHFNEQANLSNGTTLGVRTLWRLNPTLSGQGIRIAYGNVGVISTNTPGAGWQETANPDDINVEWGVWSGTPGSSTFYQGTFRGKLAFTMEGNNRTVYWSDPLFLPLTAGTAVYGELRVTVATTKKYHASATTWLGSSSLWSVGYDTGSVDGNAPSAIGASTASSGAAWPAAVSGTTARIVMPFAWQTHALGLSKAVGLEGDSIAFGSNDTGSAANPAGYTNPGQLHRGLVAIGVPAVRLTLAGDLASLNTPGQRPYRGQMFEGVTHSIWEYGTNDAGNGVSAATIEGYAISAAQARAQMGIVPLISTLLPRTTDTTTLFSTLAGQVRDNTNSRSDIINTYNAWIRAGSYNATTFPFRGKVDPDLLLRDTSDTTNYPDRWKVGTTVAGNVVAAGSSNTVFTCSAYAGQTSGRYNDYVIHFTSGTNSGLYRRVSSFSGGSGQFTLLTAATATPANPDTFDLIEVYTNDGIHPNWRGALAAQGCITAGLFSTNYFAMAPTNTGLVALSGMRRSDYDLAGLLSLVLADDRKRLALR